MNIEHLDYEQCHTLANKCQDRMRFLDAVSLSEIDLTESEYHTLETKGKIAAVKLLRDRTGKPLRICIRAIKMAHGRE